MNRLLSWAVFSVSVLCPHEVHGQTYPEPLVSIGVLDGPEELTFGLITGVVLDPAGRVFVVERYDANVRWFRPDGTYGGTLGRSGEGPGEFKSPQAIAIDASGRVHVLDNGNLRITTFLPSGEGFSYGYQVRIPSYGLDLCTIGDRRFVLTPYEPLVIRELGVDGTVVRTFADPEDPDPASAPDLGPAQASYFRSRLNQGQIACDETRSAVVFAPWATGTVRAFSAEGTLLWRTELDEFRRTRFALTKDGGCCAYLPDPASRSSHEIRGLMMRDEGTIWIAATEMSVKEGPPTFRYEVRILRADDGKEVGTITLPVELTAGKGERAIAVEQEPFPRVIVYDVGKMGVGSRGPFAPVWPSFPPSIRRSAHTPSPWIIRWETRSLTRRSRDLTLRVSFSPFRSWNERM